MTTRIVRLPKHNKVLVGKDLSEIFEPGMIYEINEFMGEITIKKLGKTSLPEDAMFDAYPNQNSTISAIMTLPGSGPYCYLLTEEEATELHNKQYSDTPSIDDLISIL